MNVNLTLPISLFLLLQVNGNLKQDAGDLLFLHMLPLVMKLLHCYCSKIIMIDGWIVLREKIGRIPRSCQNIQQVVM